MRHGLYDPTEGSAPLPQQYECLPPGAVKRAYWRGFRDAVLFVIFLGIMHPLVRAYLTGFLS